MLISRWHNFINFAWFTTKLRLWSVF
jgi:hypothetical protein